VTSVSIAPAVVVAGLVAALALAAVDGESGLLTWLDLSEERSALHAQIDEKRRVNEALARQIEALQNDPYEADRAIREALDFAKPGETVVRFKRRDPLQDPEPPPAVPD
jgi:cell division protein FtsB